MEQKTSGGYEQNILVDLTAQIVAAYIANNRVKVDVIDDVIGSVYSSLAGAVESSQRAGAIPVPAVPVKKSIYPDYLICLEDGLKLKMLKRHIRTSYGLTPEQYRAKWSLPADYPMAAPNYTLSRSEFAKSSGFGTKKTRKWTARKLAAE